MGKDWIERQDMGFLTQARNFTTRIVADPGAFALSSADAALLLAECDDFAAKLAAATVTNMWSRAATTAKNQARKKLAARMRDFGGRIRANQSISDSAKILLSLTVPGDVRSAPAGAPDSRPMVRIQSVVNNSVHVLLLDEATPHSRKRPRGVVGAQVLFAAGDAPPGPNGNWRSPVVTLSSKASLQIPWLPPGTQIWVCARWFDNRGRTGPVSNPASAHVGAMSAPVSLAA